MYFIIAILIIAALAWILLKKKKTIVPADVIQVHTTYHALLMEHVAFYKNLSETGQQKFETRISEFLNDVNIEGVGTVITDLDRVLIASSAVIPIFGLGNWRYNNLTNVILYPDTFDKEFQFEGENRSIMGMVGSGYMNGQMLLSRGALLKGFSAAAGKENTGIHEFVHLLDGADGATDGVPESLLAHQYALPWLSLMHKEMHRIKEGNSDINPYALTNEAEFLAVAAEYFFEKPEQLQHKHPELYAQLSRIFGQDPVAKPIKS